jgi:hypothetical protein
MCKYKEKVQSEFFFSSHLIPSWKH